MEAHNDMRTDHVAGGNDSIEYDLDSKETVVPLLPAVLVGLRDMEWSGFGYSSIVFVDFDGREVVVTSDFADSPATLHELVCFVDCTHWQSSARWPCPVLDYWSLRKIVHVRRMTSCCHLLGLCLYSDCW